MKNMIKMLIGILLICTLVGCGGTKNSNNSNKNLEDKFIVGLDDSFPPMGFKNENGQVVGFDIDLAKEVAKRIGVSVEFKSVDWDGILLSLNNKDIDVIWNGLTITKDRKEKISFSKPYLKNRQLILVNKKSKISSKKDLKEKVIGVQLGSSSDEALNKDNNLVKETKEIKKYSNNMEALMDLKWQRIDAIVIDEVVARYYMTKNVGIYRVLEDNLGQEEYGVGYRKSDKEFGEKLDKVLDKIKQDGTMQKIYEKWFKEK